MITQQQANQLRHLIGRRVAAAIFMLLAPENEEAQNAADRDDVRSAKDLANYIEELEKK